MSLAGVIVFTLAGPIVNILLGKGWEAAIPVVKLLSILGVVRGIAGSTHSLLVAKEKQKYSAIVVMVSTVVLLISIVPFIDTYGLIGAGLAAILGTVLSLPFTLYFINKTLKT
jgi:O-antigen/teichoic acid export membrane protein